MKKKYLYLIPIFIIFIIFRFGIQIGNVRIGKQLDLQVSQNKNFKESPFYKKYYSKEELIVLNMWATWCNPCIEEIPELNNVKNKFNKRPIKFISLSMDKDSLKLIKFLKKEKFKYEDITLTNLEFIDAIINTLENKPTDKWISSYSIPVTYLIKDQKVIQKIEGKMEKDELINYLNTFIK